MFALPNERCTFVTINLPLVCYRTSTLHRLVFYQTDKKLETSLPQRTPYPFPSTRTVHILSGWFIDTTFYNSDTYTQRQHFSFDFVHFYELYFIKIMLLYYFSKVHRDSIVFKMKVIAERDVPSSHGKKRAWVRPYFRTIFHFLVYLICTYCLYLQMLFVIYFKIW